MSGEIEPLEGPSACGKSNFRLDFKSVPKGKGGAATRQALVMTTSALAGWAVAMRTESRRSQEIVQRGD
jgi:hypothetical protein